MTGILGDAQPGDLVFALVPAPATRQDQRGTFGGGRPDEDCRRPGQDEALALGALLALGWFD